jgi:hypothetical protein
MVVPRSCSTPGDFDPSGEDIDRDFIARADCFTKTIRVALNAEQVTEYDLSPAMGKSTDSRARAFTARHGRLVQVELDALPPDVLRGLFEDALEDLWDVSAYEAVLEQEDAERKRLWAFQSLSEPLRGQSDSLLLRGRALPARR